MKMTGAEVRTRLTEPLAERGFQRVGARNLWFDERDGYGLGLCLVRNQTQIEAVITGLSVAEIVWGNTPQSIHDTRNAAFFVRTFGLHPRSEVFDQVADAADWLDGLRQLDDLLDLLSAQPGEGLGVDGIGAYGNWGYRIFAAAALAVSVGCPRTALLVEQALEENTKWPDRINTARRERLVVAMGPTR